MSEKKTLRVTSPVFRLSFPNLKAPKSNFEGQKPAYSVQMLFDDKADLTKMKAAAHEAAIAKWGSDYNKVDPKTKKPKIQFKHPTFKNGDEKDLEDYKGKIVVEARTQQKPGVVDKDRNEILDLNEVYAGCYCRATLTVYAYDKAGNKGVSFGLQNVQKIADGPAFSGKRNAKDDFDEELDFNAEEYDTESSSAGSMETGNEEDFAGADEIEF